MLTLDQKRVRVYIFMALLERFKRYGKNFSRLFMTEDETCLHHSTLETKEQSKPWIANGEPAPKKEKTVSSAGKVMGTIFWDSHGIVFIDYLEKGKTITGVSHFGGCHGQHS